MPRYARLLGSVVVGNMGVDTYLVIRTMDVPPHEVIAQGFSLIPDHLSDEQVRDEYGVEQIIEVTDSRLQVV